MILPLLIAWLASRINRHQDHLIWCLLEENRILKTKLKGKRISLTDTERRRLAILAQPTQGQVSPIEHKRAPPDAASIDLPFASRHA